MSRSHADSGVQDTPVDRLDRYSFLFGVDLIVDSAINFTVDFAVDSAIEFNVNSAITFIVDVLSRGDGHVTAGDVVIVASKELGFIVAVGVRSLNTGFSAATLPPSVSSFPAVSVPPPHPFSSPLEKAGAAVDHWESWTHVSLCAPARGNAVA